MYLPGGTRPKRRTLSKKSIHRLSVETELLPQNWIRSQCAGKKYSPSRRDSTSLKGQGTSTLAIIKKNYRGLGGDESRPEPTGKKKNYCLVARTAKKGKVFGGQSVVYTEKDTNQKTCFNTGKITKISTRLGICKHEGVTKR